MPANRRGTWRRYLWAAPTTVLGLALAATAWRRGRIAVVDGVVEAHGPFIRWALRRLIPLPGGAAAVTLGHVVLGVDAEALDATRLHERVHVAQYERWGPFFLPAYALASAWAVVRGGDFYRDNPFEIEARHGEERAARRQEGQRRPPGRRS